MECPSWPPWHQLSARSYLLNPGRRGIWIMKPLAPNLVGSLSICSTWAEVKGNIAGASIEIRVAGTLASSHVSETRRPLPHQRYASGESDSHRQPDYQWTDQPRVSSYHCAGRAIASEPTYGENFTAHLWPGGSGDRRDARSQNRRANRRTKRRVGQRRARLAGVECDPGQAAGQPLTLNQITCNNLTASQSTVTPVEPAMPLPAPVILTPLFEQCLPRLGVASRQRHLDVGIPAVGIPATSR